MILLEPVLAYQTLKCANLIPENERQVKATVGEIILSAMSRQIQEIMHRQYSEASSPNISWVVVKIEMDVRYNENNLTNSGGYLTDLPPSQDVTHSAELHTNQNFT